MPPVEPVAAEELEAFWRLAGEPFGEAPDDDTLTYQQALSELARTFAAREDGVMVALGAAQSLDVSVPGGAAVPMAGVSLLAVLPTHRRRGLGRAVMRRLHDQAGERGEPLAGLWAAEGGIYRNYGYGVGARTAAVELDERVVWRTAHTQREPSLRLVDLDEAVEMGCALVGRIRDHTAGVPCLSEDRLRLHLFHDPPAWREGGGPRTFVAAEDGRGLASYRVSVDWQTVGPSGQANVDWLVADDGATEARLWRYLSEIDLVHSVRALGRPLDDPVPLLATDARRVRVTTTDGLWLRVLDPQAVLSARTYGADGRWVIEVVDGDGYADGRFALTAEGGEGECQAADPAAVADVTLPVQALAAAVLGDERPSRLARADLADEHTAGALASLDRMLATERAPWCPFVIE